MTLRRSDPQRFVNHQEFRARARRLLPRVVWDFIDGGVEDEATIAANRRVFGEVTFRVRKGVYVTPDIGVSVLGEPISMPIMLAPCGAARLVHPQGEKAMARAAGAVGTAYIVPHVSGHAMETVRAEGKGLLWYQLYKFGGRAVCELAIGRAKAAGYRALVVTIDNPGAKRERDMRNGLVPLRNAPISQSWPYVPQILARPLWLARFLADGRAVGTPNIVEPGATGPVAGGGVPGGAPEATFEWSDFAWIRAAWGGPLVIKGVQSGEDARRALDAGADAMIVSNHGGRNLDGEPATLPILPEVVAAVNGRAEVYFDSGIRRGTDVAKALALGARAVLIGRLGMFALAGGEASVVAALRLIEGEFRATMAAIGCKDLAQLDASFLNVPPGWAAAAPRAPS